MHPVLFKYGFIEIRFYGLMYVLAIIIGSYLLKSEVRRKGISLSDDEVTSFLMWVVISGVIGARLYYVLFKLDYFLPAPAEIVAIWHGGLAIHGGIIGGIVGGWVYLKRRDISFWKAADASAPVLILGQSLGRFGNFMNGDAYGTPTLMPWGVVFPFSSPAGMEFPGIAIHPAMLYEMAFNFAIFLFLWFKVRKCETKDGFLFALYIVLYSLGRFFVEIFRGDSLMFGPLKTAQLVSVVAACVALYLIWKLRLSKRPERIYE
ncbi:MAG: prolipoprotein diacylglyceryl transferase [Proteobacteria bacterium]|nr:prolipoprotein diacylglyceryl transferase [Pseudomonadota bacterium]